MFLLLLIFIYAHHKPMQLLKEYSPKGLFYIYTVCK